MSLGTRATNSDLVRLEAAAARAGCAMICAHESADEFHSALIGRYVRQHASQQTTLYLAAIAALGCLFVLI